MSNQDARPFTDLKKDAAEFRLKFDEDIQECMDLLDDKITELICDPDSLGNYGKTVKQNALVEFSKAKYEVFIRVKDRINQKEREWLDYISEMKKLFIENVEIFLAGTKLEVKLPSSEYQSSPGPRKSPGVQKSKSSISSIYPLISSITKNIPVLGSPLRAQKVSASAFGESSNAGDNSQFNRRSRLSASSIKLSRSPVKQTIDTEMEIDDAELDLSESHSDPSPGPRNSNKSDRSSFHSHYSQRRKSSEKEMDIGTGSKTIFKGRQAAQSKKSALSQSSSDESEVQHQEPDQSLLKKTRGRAASKSKIDTSKALVQNSLDENEVQNQEPDQSLLKKTRGRAAAKSKVDTSKALVQNGSDEMEIQSQEPDQSILKKARGRAAAKSKIDASKALVQSSSDENEVQNQEPDQKVLKKTRGRAAAKSKIDTSKALLENSSDENEVQMQEPDQSVFKKPKGRATAKSKIDTSKDFSTVPRAVARGRRAAKTISEDEVPEPGPSKSPKKVCFSTDGNISDDLEIEAPVVRPVKSAARRKTLIPKFENVTDAEIIPDNPTRSRSKRKTIGGVSELQTVAPSKRLKVGTQKNVSSQEEDANDNLLESDDNYSEWMPLKNVDGKIPTCPAVYEVKVWRAKKPAYIGSCESLRQKLTLYNMRQNSGHKHLDKFIDRNYDDIQVRYEVLASFDDAKDEVKSRVKNFVAQHKTTPAYN